MKNLYCAFIYTILALAATSCAISVPASNAEQLFMEMYKGCSMNKDIRLSPEKPVNISEDVNVLAESISDNSVIFPAGYNLQIFQFDNEKNKWVERENHAQYFPVDGKYIFGRHDPKNEYDYSFIGFNPIVIKQTTLRVALHGHIYKDGVETEECSGAFTDIVVSP